MKKLFFAAFAAISLTIGFVFATHVAAETVTIFTGTKGGGYDKAAQAIATRLSQRGIAAEVVNRKGSDDITLQACANDVSIWIAQGDAIYKREVKEGCFLPVLAEYGSENAMLFFPPDSKIDELDELDGSSKVFVADVGSGSELSFKNMQAIEQEFGRGDAWSKAELVTGDLRRVNALAGRGQVTAAFLVMKPSDARVLKLIETGWTLGYLYDKDINDLKYGQAPLYEAQKVDVGGQKNWTYQVKSFVGTTEVVELDKTDIFDAALSALE